MNGLQPNWKDILKNSLADCPGSATTQSFLYWLKIKGYRE